MKQQQTSQVEKLVKFTGKKPSVQLRELKAIREQETDTFIDRSYRDAREVAAGLKTEKGRINTLNNYFKKMEAYFDRMSEKNYTHIDALHLQHISETEKSI